MIISSAIVPIVGLRYASDRIGLITKSITPILIIQNQDFVTINLFMKNTKEYRILKARY